MKRERTSGGGASSDSRECLGPGEPTLGTTRGEDSSGDGTLQGEVIVLRILFRLQSNCDGPGRDGIGGPHLRSENPLRP